MSFNRSVLDRQFIRFLVVGCANTLVGFGLTFLLLNLLAYGYFASTIIGNMVGCAISFYLNRKYTFRHDGNVPHTLVKFLLVFMLSYLLSYASGKLFIYFALNDGIVVTQIVAENIAIVIGAIVYTITNYIFNAKLTFTNQQK